VFSDQDTAVLPSNVTDFVFNASDAVFATMACDLYVNSTIEESDSSVINNANTAFLAVVLPPGMLSWYIECTDGSSNTGSSVIRTITTPIEITVNLVSTTANVSSNINATTNANINLTTTQDVTGTLNVTQYNANPESASATLGNGFAALGIDIFITINASSNIVNDLSWYILTISYLDADLPSGIDESTLRIYFFNATSGQWQVEPDSGVDTAANEVWANITHFSTFSTGGSQQSTSGGGGGGTGGCKPLKWECTDWSGCDNGTQTRTCVEVNCNTKYSMDKPEETRSCRVVPVVETVEAPTVVEEPAAEEVDAAVVEETAPLTPEPIAEPVAEPTPEVEPVIEPPEASNLLPLLLLALVIVVLGVAVFLKKKHKK